MSIFRRNIIVNDTIARKPDQKNQPATVRHYRKCLRLLVQMNKYHSQKAEVAT